LINFYQTTQHNNPEESHLDTCCCENLKSHIDQITYVSHVLYITFVLFQSLLTEEDSHSHMESGSNTDDDDYETYLYSLLHHSGDNLLEENYLLPGPLSSERLSVEQSGSSEVIGPFYQTKRSKVSRWDMVKSLTGTSDVPPYNRRTATLSSDTKNKRVIKPGQEQEIQNNYSSLLHAYKEARSSCMQSAPAKERNFQKAYAKYRCRRRTEKENGFSRALNAKGKSYTHTSSPIIRESSVQGRNTVPVSNSFFQDSVVPSAVENYLTSVPRNTSTYINNSTDNGNFNNYTYNENKCSKSQNSSHENMVNDDLGADRNKNRSCDVRNEMRDNLHEQLESEMSKYNLRLNKDKQNSMEESVIVLNSSDSDNESVVEVAPPLRNPPLVVSLSSDEEALNNMSDEKKPKKVSVEDDIVVLYTGGKSNISMVSPTVTDSSIHDESMESVGSCATVVLDGKSTTREGLENKRKKRKKKKQKEGAENGKCLERSLNSVFQTSPSTSSFISPKSWSKDMSHFYNDSWGGENFNVHQLQKSMSGKKESSLFYLVLETFITCELKIVPVSGGKAPCILNLGTR
jgi:hypothetical protein